MPSLKISERDSSVAVKADLRTRAQQFRVVATEPRRVDLFVARMAPAVVDFGLVCCNAFLASYLWNGSVSSGILSRGTSFRLHWGGSTIPGFLIVYAFLTLLFMQAFGLYSPNRSLSWSREGTLAAGAVVLATLFVVGIAAAWNSTPLHLADAVTVGILNVGVLSGRRFWHWSHRQRSILQGNGLRNALIVGADEHGQSLARYLESNPQLGYVVKGFVDPDGHSDPRLLGKLDDLDKIVSSHFIEEVLIADTSQRRVLEDILREASRQQFAVKVVPEWLTERHRGWARIGNLATLVLHEAPEPSFRLWAKRAGDIALSGIGLLLALPVIAIIAIAIKLDSRGPVIYRSFRVGKKGQSFVFYKFRTMVHNAHALKSQILHLNERDGPLFKVSNDPRLTRIGSLLRKYSLDELPQLWNVVRGDMSLVGPRPALPEELEHYQPVHMRRLTVTPGLTGLWQVTARTDASFETYMDLDLYYVNNWSLSMDCRILLQTLPAVLRAEGL